MFLSHSFTMRGSHVASLVKFRPSGLGGNNVTDRWKDGRMKIRWKVGRMEINCSRTPYYAGKSCSKFLPEFKCDGRTDRRRRSPYPHR